MPWRFARDVTPREEMTAEDTVKQYLPEDTVEQYLPEDTVEQYHPEDTVDYNLDQYRPELRQV